MAQRKRTTSKTTGAAATKAAPARTTSRGTARPAAPAPERPSRGKTTGAAGAAGAAGTTRSTKIARPVIPDTPSPVEEIVMPTLPPSELYRREKRRRESEGKVTDDPIAEARREYLAMLAAEAEKGKGGRPKGSGKKKEEKVEDDE